MTVLTSLPCFTAAVSQVSSMALIRDVVQEALKTGYLTIEAEEQLRVLLTTQYELEDFYAFMALQEAAMSGLVKQESREQLRQGTVD